MKMIITSGKRRLKSFLVATGFVIGGLLIFFYLPGFDPEQVRVFVDGFGAAAPIVFIIVCIGKPILFFVPSLGLTFVAGAVFGPFYGTLYVILGGIGSTAVGFFMARHFGRKSIERFVSRKPAFLNFDEKMVERGFKTILLLRFFNIPWDIVSYAAGLSGIRFRDFYLASLLALIPASFVFTYFGYAVTTLSAKQILLAGTGIFVMGSIPHILGKLGLVRSIKYQNSKEDNST